MYSPSNCNEIEAHIACSCETDLARVRGVALIHRSFYTQLMIDPTDATVWEAGVTAGMIKVYPQTQGDYEPSPINTRGFGYSEETLLAYLHTVNFVDPNYIGNLPHYNSITGSRNFYIAFRSEKTLRISQRPCNIVATNPIKNNITDRINYNVTARWTYDKLPFEFDIPYGVFVCAPAVVYGASFDNSFDDSFDIP